MLGNGTAGETNTHNNTQIRVFSENNPFVETVEKRRERVYNSAENDSPSRQLARYIKETGVKYGDEIEGVDFEYLRKNTGVNLSAVANLALAPSVPDNVRQEVSELTNYFTLHWEAPKQGKQPAGYYVLIRETDQSQGQMKIHVDGTEARLPYSKDNYFFAVQSADAEGHESLATFARGGR
ncbi:MAG: M28 family metallopeptidase [Tannerellaceae bacterium]|jgi:hypothetical protein|nr:M28 family metallopeptidase [Tannerellaceae bacterium]